MHLFAPTNIIASHGGRLPGYGRAGQYVHALYVAYIFADLQPGGSFGKVFKAIDRNTGETVAIKHVWTSLSLSLAHKREIAKSYQIDLEDSSEELADIQAEIALLSTCHSPYITEYKTSFVKGVKLWIVMEYLGGGSAADLVRTTLKLNMLKYLLMSLARSRSLW